jgi:circadian clock protein KaiC
MADRMQTGIAGLDRLLGGGFLHHNSVLLKGSPGSGKTTLGIQALVAGATEFDEPGIMVSFEQFPQQLQRDTETFGWDLKRLAEKKRLAVFFASPEDLAVPATRNENPLVAKIVEATNELGARRLLVDSVSHLRAISGEIETTPRRALLRFLNTIKTVGLTPLLTCEIGLGDHDYEDYLVDSVVILHHVRGSDGQPHRREIEILKTRGQEAIGGRHPLRIAAGGIEVFPHVLPASDPPTVSDEPMRSGLEGLDRLLGGGYTPASSALIAGMAGTFKTTLAVQFLAEGAAQGERGLLVSFQEPPGHLMQFLAGRGIDLKTAVESGDVTLWHRAPRDTCLEELVWQLGQSVTERGIRRLVIDSTNDLEHCQLTPGRAAPALKLLLSEMAHRGVTTVLTQRIERVSGRNPIADIRHVSQVDTIIYLGLAEIESQLEKVISVLKHRGAKADAELRGISCGTAGLKITDRFVGLSGVLEGSPLGQRKQRVEEIFQPLYVLRDFLAIAQAPDLDAAQRKEILGNLSSETGKLIDLMTEHFGEPDVDKG